jgi:hypothetical protein
MSNPTTIAWKDPTTNVDGSPIADGEITNYLIGVRSTTVAGSAAGTYPVQANAAGAAASSELISALGEVLVPDTYAVAVQTVGPTNSAWSAETTFVIAPPVLPVPNPPTGLTVT